MLAEDLSGLTDAELRRELTALVGEFSFRAQRARTEGTRVPDPIDPGALTPTDVLLAARYMLDSFDVDAFELDGQDRCAPVADLARGESVSRIW